MSKIIWKGIDSDSIAGLIISKLPPITKPKLRTNIIKIDGRDGDIIEELGYESYDKVLEIGLSYNYDINQIINYFNGEGQLILSNEEDKYYIAKIIDKIDYNSLINFKKAKLKFHVQPFKYKLNENIIDINITNQTSTIIQNIGLEKSKPIFHLYGNGTIEIYHKGIQVFSYTFDSDNEVIIDSEKQDAYLNKEFKNRNMLGEFPIFDIGANQISWNGNLNRIIVEPKSRWL